MVAYQSDRIQKQCDAKVALFVTLKLRYKHVKALTLRKLKFLFRLLVLTQ